MELDEQYQLACDTPSDINQHLPVLACLAGLCDHVTEFGVREIVSTWALAMGRPRFLCCYDLNVPTALNDLLSLTAGNNINFDFRQASTLHCQIEATDFLFIDTLHNYDQLAEELRLHAGKVSCFIAFHDTTTFGYSDESGGGEGLVPAIEAFLSARPDWSLAIEFTNNNGLTVLKRSQPKLNIKFHESN